jgi:hypothetical protein
MTSGFTAPEKDLVLYMDLMGFKNVIKSADGFKKRAILDLLKDLKRHTGNAQFEQKQKGERSWSIKQLPAVTAFSDNIVFSFPSYAISDWATFLGAVSYLASVAGRVTEKALEIGCLMRGGMVLDQLWHQDGIVFGPGLVEAYILESTCAHFPRIVTSEDISEKVGPFFLIEQDHDGLHVLDYISHSFIGWPTPISNKISRWETLISQQISSFNESTPLRVRQNWKWFENSVASKAKVARDRLATITQEPSSASIE